MKTLFLVALIPLLLLPLIHAIAAVKVAAPSLTAGNFDNKTFDKWYKKINSGIIVPLAGINETRAALQLFKTNHTAPTDGLLLEEVTLVNICLESGMAK
jgi:hypothetical protein